jgi:hypothetical protein
MNAPTTPYWQLSLSTPGGVVEGVNDIQQCLIVLINTAKGSDPLRPDFGAGIEKAIDLPASQVAPGLKASILEQVALYEPRAEVLSVNLVQSSVDRVIIRLTWRAKGEALAQIQNLDINLFR